MEPIIVKMPSVSTDRADSTQDAFFIRLHTDEGLVGLGEADTSPYLAKTMVEMPSSHGYAQSLREVLVGRNPLEIDRLWNDMYMATYYYGRFGFALHVMSAVDMALWDLAGKYYEQPLHQLWGGARQKSVKAYASELMPPTVEETRQVAEKAVADGFSALKLGWGTLGQDLQLDELRLRAAREALGPDRGLMLDGGMKFTVRSATELARRVEDIGLYWFEEPFFAENLSAYKRLSDATNVRVAAGEQEATAPPYRRLAEHGVDVLQPDLARCGGPTVGLQVARIAEEHSIEVIPHCWSTGVLVAATLHLVATLAKTSFSEFSVVDSPLAGGGELLREPFRLQDGRLHVPEGHGLGIELNDEVVEKLRCD
ncbi:mandelate racemase/muconate lactonizing enzyme family protein [Streptomyces phaeochromogenes]|uniref:mandelate racemase/muconate lactonizing enzyme family protein n=1 Tax=Streptomyces phaeochromogenes TaxID=1923 RepID=UPI002DD989E4|nr:mandelate racemase/muconate lactonizing enzyme family protein [Streptomyces phaeochromogenes]WRZ34623.1 mandelate racemase/muconate lactonizing enzyme family protein [Streptomyces phaeochromogenes]